LQCVKVHRCAPMLVGVLSSLAIIIFLMHLSIFLVSYSLYGALFRTDKDDRAVCCEVSWLGKVLSSTTMPFTLMLSPENRDRLCVILYIYLCNRFSFLVHYRALIFPFLIRQGKPTPFFTFLLALLFCIYNGYLQGRSLSTYAEYPSDWLKRFMGWLIGMAINIHSDHILRNLRKPGETGYKIPRGGMFEYVSGANFFGEILEWFGFSLACCTIESLAFALCTLFILGSRTYSDLLITSLIYQVAQGFIHLSSESL
uniref:Steroid 5 alpha-reductase 1 n=1 Tax=Meleagris gallopavo TaxID=9103 RepID=G1N3N3_MELGA